MRPAITGESGAGISTLETMPCHFTASVPAAAMVEPTTPPMRACDELDGMPRYHVARFHEMLPARPANTTVRVTSVVLTRPLAMVAATLKDRKAPTRLSAPDSATATLGGSARVAIEVAIALPVSWKPLVKSNASAVTITRPSTTSLFTAGSLSSETGPRDRSVHWALHSPGVRHPKRANLRNPRDASTPRGSSRREGAIVNEDSQPLVL